MKKPEEYVELGYHKVVHRDEDGDYVVEVLEFPGCMTHGSTEREALANSVEAMLAWIEAQQAVGDPVPEPLTDNFSGRVLVRMPRSLHARLAQLALCERTSLNQLIVSKLSDGAGGKTRQAASGRH